MVANESAKVINDFIIRCTSRVSSGSIVSDYGTDDRTIGVRSPVGAKDFSSILWVQTGSGAHPASCTMGTGGPFPGGKARPGRDADHSHLVPSSWMSRSYISSPPSASMTCSGTALLFYYTVYLPPTYFEVNVKKLIKGHPYLPGSYFISDFTVSGGRVSLFK
jgi:hypothetical protein